MSAARQSIRFVPSALTTRRAPPKPRALNHRDTKRTDSLVPGLNEYVTQLQMHARDLEKVNPGNTAHLVE